MQQPDGSFGYWPGATSTNEWVTPYAGMALTLASQNGGNVPPTALESLSQYLIKSLRGAGEAKTSYELENHARSLYTLALLGKAQPPYHALMAEKLPFMSDSARGLLAAAMAVSSEGRPKVLSVAKSVLESKVKYRTLENGGYWSPGNSSQATAPHCPARHRPGLRRYPQGSRQNPQRPQPLRPLAQHLGQRLEPPRHFAIRLPSGALR